MIKRLMDTRFSIYSIINALSILLIVMYYIQARALLDVAASRGVSLQIASIFVLPVENSIFMVVSVFFIVFNILIFFRSQKFLLASSNVWIISVLIEFLAFLALNVGTYIFGFSAMFYSMDLY